MEIYKFGGASLATPAGMQRMAQLVAQYYAPQQALSPLVVVVSAIGKTTNALEHALSVAIAKTESGEGTREHAIAKALEPIEKAHREMAAALKLSAEHLLPIERLLDHLRLLLTHPPSTDYDTLYDQLISQGELLSSLLFTGLLCEKGLLPEWVDIRSVLRTYPGHRGAVVDTNLSAPLVQTKFVGKELYITQGFIASDPLGATTTLGREGSDYSAAILGCFLQAERVTIWKDVDGLFNADPKLFPDAQRIDTIDYREVIEMSYNGAKVIHEKALKPLQNANIPLYVRSFLHQEGGQSNTSGTRICHVEEETHTESLPLIAVLEQQLLLTVAPRDLSFALQDSASRIFELIRLHHLTVRLVQNSAVRLSLSIDYDPVHFPDLLKVLQEDFLTSYNLDVVLVSIRHIPTEWRTAWRAFSNYLLLQETRSTSQYLLLRSVWNTEFAPQLRQAMGERHGRI